MAAKPAKKSPGTRSPAAPTSVDAFLAALDHPFKPEILALRQHILAVDPAIGESIKWNAPSFHTTEHFATMQLRARDGLQLILHRGAKKRDDPAAAIADPDAQLEWLASDRASIKFANLADLHARAPALTAILHQWISQI